MIKILSWKKAGFGKKLLLYYLVGFLFLLALFLVPFLRDVILQNTPLDCGDFGGNNCAMSAYLAVPFLLATIEIITNLTVPFANSVGVIALIILLAGVVLVHFESKKELDIESLIKISMVLALLIFMLFVSDHKIWWSGKSDSVEIDSNSLNFNIIEESGSNNPNP